MAGKRPEVEHTKNRFLREVASARGLVSAITSIPQQVHPNSPAGLHPKHVRQVVELAFMGLVASWEEFLELSLVRYVAGGNTGSGYKPVPKFGLANDIAHAYELLSRDPTYNPLKHYLKVTDIKWVRNSADFFFQTHTFSSLVTKTDLMSNATSIRNRVAHSSIKCRADFKASVIYFISPAGGKLKQGYTPGDLLLSTAVRHFGPAVIAKKVSHFEAYAMLYEELAQKIVP